MGDDFGKRLREARERAGISQEELGAAAGVRLGSIYRYEAGKQEPKLRTINAIAVALDCDVGWLMTGEAPGHDEDGIKIPPNLAKFLQTEIGQRVTEEQKRVLLDAVRHYRGDTTVAGWRTTYTGLFEMRPEPYEPTEEELGGLMKVDD